MMVRIWLAPVVLTVSGRAASEQTCIMTVPSFISIIGVRCGRSKWQAGGGVPCTTRAILGGLGEQRREPLQEPLLCLGRGPGRQIVCLHGSRQAGIAAEQPLGLGLGEAG